MSLHAARKSRIPDFLRRLFPPYPTESISPLMGLAPLIFLPLGFTYVLLGDRFPRLVSLFFKPAFWVLGVLLGCEVIRIVVVMVLERRRNQLLDRILALPISADLRGHLEMVQDFPTPDRPSMAELKAILAAAEQSSPSGG